jgi:tRNA pseudouridine55 synthase
MQPDTGGIVVVDKPAGISSAQVVSRVKKIYKARKAGHAGTLDPFATGVLVCCLNRATRLAQFMLRGNKTYRGLLRLGITTDTQDVTGKVITTNDTATITQHDIRAVFKQFEGPIQQRPPIYSALKHKGVPLYRLARRGQPVQKEARAVLIETLRVEEIQGTTVAFEVTCSAGTYIRTLCDDIGRRLGCGGHLKALRRTASGAFRIEKAVALEQLERQAKAGEQTHALLPMTEALHGMTAVRADTALAHKIAHGAPVSPTEFGPDQATTLHGWVQVLSPEDELLAVLECRGHEQDCHYCCVFN